MSLDSPKKKDADMQFTLTQWKESWDQKNENVVFDPTSRSIQVNRSYIEKYIDNSATFFLEVGCGTARSSLDTALNNQDLSVICLDVTPSALRIAKRLFKENNAYGLFVCGDARALPFKDMTFDFIFSDGAIEHFKETSAAISEMHRVLRDGGRIMVTVPRISIPMLTWGQLRGNTPNIPVLQPILEFIQRRVFQSKLMKNGLELSFTQRQLKNLLHRFSKVDVGLFYGGLITPLYFFEWSFLVKIRKIICYMIYGFAIK